MYLFSRFSSSRLKRFHSFHEHRAVSPITWSLSKSNQWWRLTALTTELMLKCLRRSLLLIAHRSYKSHQFAPWRHPPVKAKVLLHDHFPTQNRTLLSTCQQHQWRVSDGKLRLKGCSSQPGSPSSWPLRAQTLCSDPLQLLFRHAGPSLY